MVEVWFRVHASSWTAKLLSISRMCSALESASKVLQKNVSANEDDEMMKMMMRMMKEKKL